MAVDPARLCVIPLFADLTDDERTAVAAKLEERHVDTNEHLSHEGGAGYFFFVLESGSATVTMRLSRTTMKRASDTIARVQRVRGLGGCMCGLSKK